MRTTRKVWSGALVAVIATLPVPAAAAKGKPQRVAAETEPCLSLYEAPKEEAAIRGCLMAGTEVRSVKRRAAWTKVRLEDGRVGWVEAEWLEEVEPVSPPEGVPATAESEVPTAPPVEEAPAAQPPPTPEAPAVAPAAPDEVLPEETPALAEPKTRVMAPLAADPSTARPLTEPEIERLRTESDELRGRLLAAERENESLRERLRASESRLAERDRALETIREQLAAARRQEAERRSRLETAAAGPRPANGSRRPAEPLRPAGVAVNAPFELAPASAGAEVAAEPAESPPTADAPSDAEVPIPGPGELTPVVEAWARAWSEQRVEDYLAAYAEDFAPSSDLDRAAWEAERRDRVSRPAFIRIGVSSLGVRPIGPGRGSVRFTQAYESDTYSDLVNKRLELVWEEGAWKILEETAEE